MNEQKKKYKTNDISTGYIQCNTCNEIKELDSFYKKNGYYTYKCKKCISIKNSSTYIKRPKKYKVYDEEIKCKTCGEIKPLVEYQKSTKGYYNYECKKCCSEKRKLAPKLTEEQILFNEGFKKCKVCEKILPFKNFPTKEPKKCRQSTCTSCKNYKRNNSENYKEYQKLWRQTEKGKQHRRMSKRKYKSRISESDKIKKEQKRKEREILLKEREIRRQQREERKLLKEKNKDEYKKLMEYYSSDEWKSFKKQKARDKQYKRWKRRWENDEVFAMKVRLRNLIRNSFRKQGYSKFELKTENIIGMNYNDFKEYMESMFLEGMNWENRGEWHIDHIIPLSSAKSKEELVKLCHYTNLQPLWAEDNIKKGDKIL